jgi:hypothetical protein
MANSLTRSVPLVTIPFHCYILIAGEAGRILSLELKQENASGIDFDHSRRPPARCDDYGLSLRDARFIGGLC